ncbi:MAG: right-handed parallel beta-helix repeat-containing protein, partial [Polyangiaceae bacterium]|nr:right-handed parallel beta-helix repeat-containing protein [Polyangiaceae bacterium]
MRYGALLAGVILVWSGRAAAADIPADPSDYKAKVGTLTPGDTLVLAPGRYRTLTLSGLNGSDAKPIVIAGPSSGAPAVFVADPGPCCNTVEIKDSSYVVLRNVTIDGNHVDGAFGVSAKSGVVHHITIEGCNFINHDGSQQHDGISTKVATWGWVIRRNRISGVGTGLYLGNSNGAAPFIGGLIEGNLILDSIGYGMQIKYQKPRASVPGMPTAPSTTIIRDNVFIKTDRPSPDGDRPNLLVGGFPDSGPGSQDLYEIYGNFFFHNPNESLFQGSGRVSLHDNVFVDVKGTAIRLQNHDLPLKLAHVYNNTIYAAGTGIGFGSKASEGDLVTGNLIFATTAISGNVTNQSDNLTDTVANAPSYVASPSLALGAMDFFPLAGKCEGSPLALASVSSETDYDRDFNGASKGGFTFRGAYAGSGTNPGWQLAGGFKDDATGPGTGGSAGSGGASAGSGGASAGSGGASAGSGGASAGSGGA